MEGIRERQVTRKKDPNWRPKRRPRITNGEWQQAKRTKRNPYKQIVMNHISEVCRTDPPPTHRQFIERLHQTHGITAIPSVAAHADRISGYRFALGDHTYKGSTVGYPWGELQRQLTPPKTKGEYQDLRGYSRQVDAGSAYDAVRSLRSAIWEVARKGGTIEDALRKDGWTVRGDIISKGGEEHDLRDYAPMAEIRLTLARIQTDKAEFRRRSREAWEQTQKTKWRPKYKPFGQQTQPEEIVYLAILAPELVLIMLILALLIALLCGWGKQPRPSELWKTSNVHNIQARSAIADLRQQLLGLSQPATRFPRAKKKAEEKETPKAERRRGAWGISVEEVASFAGKSWELHPQKNVDQHQIQIHRKYCTKKNRREKNRRKKNWWNTDLKVLSGCSPWTFGDRSTRTIRTGARIPERTHFRDGGIPPRESKGEINGLGRAGARRETQPLKFPLPGSTAMVGFGADAASCRELRIVLLPGRIEPREEGETHGERPHSAGWGPPLARLIGRCRIRAVEPRIQGEPTHVL